MTERLIAIVTVLLLIGSMLKMSSCESDYRQEREACIRACPMSEDVYLHKGDCYCGYKVPPEKWKTR